MPRRVRHHHRSEHPADPADGTQLELALEIAPCVRLVRRPGGVVEIHPDRPRLEGTVREAARVLGVSMRTVRRMLEEGQIRGWKPRAHWRVDMATVYAVRADGERAGEE